MWACLRRQLLLFYLPFATAIIFGGYTAYSSLTEPELTQLEVGQNQAVERQRALTGETLETVISDLRFLADLYLASLPESPVQFPSAAVAETFRLFSLRRNIYDQIRFLDAGGMERLRVNLGSGNPEIVPPEALQPKAQRYYFDAAMTLGRGQIYISPFDLNIEHGRLEQPPKPMLRFAAPLFDASGQRLGVVVLNFLGNRLFDVLEPHNGTQGRFMLLNAEGYWLHGGPPGADWAFMYDDRRRLSFARLHPAAWARLQESGNGQFRDDGSLYTFTTLTLSRVSGPGGIPGGRIVSGDSHWKLVRELPLAAVEARHRAIAAWLLPLAGLLLLGTLSVMLLLARNQARQAATEQHLERQRELADVTLQSIGDGVIATDLDGHVQRMNPAAERLTGWTAGEALGLPLEEVFRARNSHTREPLGNPARIAIRERSLVPLARDTVLQHRDGQERLILDSAAPIRNSSGAIVGGVVVFRDVTDARELANRLSWESSHDPLTGLINRREFESHLERALAGAHAHNLVHALLYIDLDQFKIVNDTCGHQAGDELLLQLAARLQHLLDNSGLLSRLGGDEFGVLLEGCSEERALRMAEQIQENISQLQFNWEERTFRIACSTGLAAIDAETVSPQSALSRADIACNMAKDAGRNRIHVYREGDARVVRHQAEMDWYARIQQALEQEELRLYVQPIVPLQNAGVNPLRLRYEVLLRLREADGRITPAGAFIGAVERYSLMPALDRWVVRSTLDWLARHYAHRPEELPQLSINISGSSLADESFLAYVQNQFWRSPASPSAVCFEITETAAIANLNQAVRFIDEMKKLGCRFALDDFGSGLSSFAYLKNLPVDYLKIDGSFVHVLTEDPVAETLVDAFNRIGHAMGLETVAEYVDNEATRERLAALGVDYAQGHGVGFARDIDSLLEDAAEPALG
jgi:diguanylate cyclase (GGDEF)-like protein/PAS domain S-box-containing protein